MLVNIPTDCVAYESATPSPGSGTCNLTLRGLKIMATTTRIYSVDGKHLVRAQSQAQALRHIVKNRHKVEVASQDDIVKMIGDGVKVEETSEQEGE